MRIKIIQCIALSILLSWMPNVVVLAQNTTVYVVRHAEKDMSDPANNDPALSYDGMNRVKDLDTTLRHVHLDAVFSTRTTRTEETARPLAKQNKVRMQNYDAKNLAALAERIKTKYKGKNILVVGHSNTVRSTVQALGGICIMSIIPDNVFNLLYIVTIDSSGKVEVQENTYGKK